jgi:hypothetical protein
MPNIYLKTRCDCAETSCVGPGFAADPPGRPESMRITAASLQFARSLDAIAVRFAHERHRSGVRAGCREPRAVVRSAGEDALAQAEGTLRLNDRNSPAAAAGQEQANKQVVLRTDVVGRALEHRNLGCESLETDSGES